MLFHLKWMLNWRQDQRNYMLIQSFHSTDKPSDILRKIWWYSSHLDYLIIKPVLPIYGLLCTKFWIPRLEFENELDMNILVSRSDLLFSLLNTNSSFPPRFLSFLHFLSSCSKPTRLHLSFVNWSVRMQQTSFFCFPILIFFFPVQHWFCLSLSIPFFSSLPLLSHTNLTSI